MLTETDRVTDEDRMRAYELVARFWRLSPVFICPTDLLNVGGIGFIIQFCFASGAVTSIYIILKDWQSKSDVVITNMTTLPDPAKGKGLGTKALGIVFAWARENGLKELRATQVSSEESKRFWIKNGFTRCPNPNPMSDYIFLTS